MPISEPLPIQEGIYHYGEDGLMVDSFPRASTEEIRDALLDYRDGPPFIDRNLTNETWWKSQIRLYGIIYLGEPGDWPILTMARAFFYELIDPEGLQVSDEVQEIEEQLKQRYQSQKKRRQDDWKIEQTTKRKRIEAWSESNEPTDPPLKPAKRKSILVQRQVRLGRKPQQLQNQFSGARRTTQNNEQTTRSTSRRRRRRNGKFCRDVAFGLSEPYVKILQG